MKILTFDDVYMPCPSCGAMIDAMQGVCDDCKKEKEKKNNKEASNE